MTEIRPGLVMTSTNPVVYLDARRDPANPTVIGTGAIPDDRCIHGNLWPRQGADRWLLVGSETDHGCTAPREGSLTVYDTRRHPKTKRFDSPGSGIDILRYDRKRPAAGTGRGRSHPRGRDTVMRESPPERGGNPYLCPLPGQPTSTAQ